MSTKDGATQSYLSILPLGKANYLDTGYYFCSPSIADKKLITQFKKIYVFVEGVYILILMLKIKLQIRVKII